MRLLTRGKIYRAFPELDGSSDEDCARFVRAARRGLFRRTIHVVLLIGESLIGLGLSFTALLLTLNIFFPRTDQHKDGGFEVAFGLGAVVAAGVPLLVAYLTRDFLLRRRIRHVLRTRRACPNCRYSFVGIPIEPDHTVTCPECAMRTRVDPSLGELTRDAEGRARFRPAPPRPPRVFTPARVRMLNRWAIYAGITLAVAVPSGLGGYELWLRAQAKRAAGERPGAARLLEHVESLQPRDANPDNNFFTVFHQAVAAVEAVDANGWRSAPSPPGETAPFPDFWALYQGDEPGEKKTEKERAYEAACAALARRVIDEYRAAGVYDRMREMASCRYAVRPVNVAGDAPLADLALPDLAKARQFARINSGRMALAVEAGDLKEYADALEATLAMNRALAMQPTLIDRLVAVAIESLMQGRLRVLLAGHPPTEWLDAIDGVLDRQKIPVDRTEMFEGERLIVLDSIGWYFSDPSKARLGKYSKGLKSLAGTYGERPSGRLGTYAQNRDTANRIFDALRAAAGRDPWERASVPSDDMNKTGLALLDLSLPSLERSLASIDLGELDRRAYPVLAALERYRNVHGKYPASLDALIPGLPASLPSDPWSGRSFLYKRVDAAKDAQGREFLLYSVGSDGRDNGGVFTLKEFPGVVTRYPPEPRAAGQDFIINDRNR